jgi:hypothetical protein
MLGGLVMIGELLVYIAVGASIMFTAYTLVCWIHSLLTDGSDHDD